MNDLAIYGIIILGALAVLGLGVKVALNFRSGNKTIIKNITSGGDVVGRDKISKNE